MYLCHVDLYTFAICTKYIIHSLEQICNRGARISEYVFPGSIPLHPLGSAPGLNAPLTLQNSNVPVHMTLLIYNFFLYTYSIQLFWKVTSSC